eukprot:717534-Amphidinium_carterae.1
MGRGWHGALTCANFPQLTVEEIQKHGCAQGHAQMLVKTFCVCACGTWLPKTSLYRLAHLVTLLVSSLRSHMTGNSLRKETNKIEGSSE